MKILMIDDSPYDRALIQRRVQKEFQDAEFVEVIRRTDLDEALTQTNFDLALTDYRLQWTDGLWLFVAHNQSEYAHAARHYGNGYWQ